MAIKIWGCRYQWPRGLRRGSAAVRLLGLWVQIPPGAWVSIFSECCVLTEVSASDWLFIQRSPTECGVSNWVCSWMLDNDASLAHWGLSRPGKNRYPTHNLLCSIGNICAAYRALRTVRCCVRMLCSLSCSQTLLDVSKYRDTWEGYARENEIKRKIIIQTKVLKSGP